MRADFIVGLAVDLSRKMPDAVAQAVDSVAPSLPHGASALADRLRKFVLATTRKIATRITE